MAIVASCLSHKLHADGAGITHKIECFEVILIHLYGGNRVVASSRPPVAEWPTHGPQGYDIDHHDKARSGTASKKGMFQHL